MNNEDEERSIKIESLFKLIDEHNQSKQVENVIEIKPIKQPNKDLISLEKYQELLDIHNWNYHYSDDHAVFKKSEEYKNWLIHLYNLNDLHSKTNDYWRLYSKTRDKNLK